MTARIPHALDNPNYGRDIVVKVYQMGEKRKREREREREREKRYGREKIKRIDQIRFVLFARDRFTLNSIETHVIKLKGRKHTCQFMITSKQALEGHKIRDTRINLIINPSKLV